MSRPRRPRSRTSADRGKADDLEAIKKAVDDAASVGGGLWLSYLFVLFYLAIAAGAVTHADLFLENPVKLPFLNVELPLLAFFFLAPILFLFVHAYTLVHLVFLTDKAKRFDQALSQQIGDDSVAAKDSNDPRVAAIAGVRGQLPSNIFIQFLAGPRDRRAGSFGWLLRLIAWSTLAVAPILLLLLFQLQFLPFHNSWITWTHRGALLVDIVLLWCLWRIIFSGRELRYVATRLHLGLPRCTAAVSSSSFPGSSRHSRVKQNTTFSQNGTPPAASFPFGTRSSRAVSTTQRDDAVLFLSNTLVLTGFNIYEGLEDRRSGQTEIARLHLSCPRPRSRGCDLQPRRSTKGGFHGAELEGAALIDAQLQGASLKDAQLQGASLSLRSFGRVAR